MFEHFSTQDWRKLNYGMSAAENFEKPYLDK